MSWFLVMQGGYFTIEDRPETSVIKYQLTLRNIPEERGPQLHRGESLQSRVLYVLRFLVRTPPVFPAYVNVERGSACEW
jgi:hypothetical protein